MEKKIKNTEWGLLVGGVSLIINFLIYDIECLLWIAGGVFGALNFSWYFSDILDSPRKPQYKYKGNIYSVEGYCDFKHPENRTWITAVIYADKNGNQYTREMEEFYNLFEKV